jgi:hypothetical protein
MWHRVQKSAKFQIFWKDLTQVGFHLSKQGINTLLQNNKKKNKKWNFLELNFKISMKIMEIQKWKYSSFVENLK